MWETALVWTACVALLLINLMGVALVALQLPGTWLMLLATGLVAWWRWGDEPLLGWWTLASLLGLALLGELVETLAGAWGTRSVGGTRRGAVLAIFGGIAGAIAGSFLIPVPIAGTLIGAALGAGGGAMAGDTWAGRDWGKAFRAGRGAAVGKLLGTVGKLVIAVTMWVVVALALVL